MKNRNSRIFNAYHFSLAVILLIASFLSSCQQQETTLNADDFRFTSPSVYYLYVPQDYTPDNVWPLWVHIHGDGGSARGGCWNKFQKYAEGYDFILLCPALNASDNHLYYQYGVSLLNPIINQVRRSYSVKSQIYLSGFSGGGVFIQYYANDYPSSISGMALMSSGFYINKSNSILRSIPMLVTVGALDGNKPKEAQAYYNSLIEAGYSAKLEVLKGVGHVLTEGAVELALEQFQTLYP